MNRSMAYVAVGVFLAGIALIASPIVLTGSERFTIAQEAGFLVAPVGVAVLLIAAVSPDPRKSTVRGTFGNADERFGIVEPSSTAGSGRTWSYNPNDPVRCRFCRTFITHDLARCPRCARARDCRSCGRPLGWVLERPTCPRCARAEPFCNCGRLEAHETLAFDHVAMRPR